MVALGTVADAACPRELRITIPVAVGTTLDFRAAVSVPTVTIVSYEPTRLKARVDTPLTMVVVVVPLEGAEIRDQTAAGVEVITAPNWSSPVALTL